MRDSVGTDGAKQQPREALQTVTTTAATVGERWSREARRLRASVSGPLRPFRANTVPLALFWKASGASDWVDRRRGLFCVSPDPLRPVEQAAGVPQVLHQRRRAPTTAACLLSDAPAVSQINLEEALLSTRGVQGGLGTRRMFIWQNWCMKAQHARGSADPRPVVCTSLHATGGPYRDDDVCQAILR